MNSPYNDVEYTLISENQIADRITELADELNALYADTESLILICLLKGSYMFCADLSRALNIHHEIDFMVASSYGADTVSRGSVEILHDLRSDIFDRHVLIVEDIIDSGYTLSRVRQMLETRHPASLRICTLLDKPSRREVDVPVDFIGFEIPDEFVIGYGLDYDEKYRNLPFVGVLKESIFADALDE